MTDGGVAVWSNKPCGDEKICYRQQVHNQGGSMSLSRRSFFRTAGAAGVGLLSSDFISARRREAVPAIPTGGGARFPPQGGGPTRRPAHQNNPQGNAHAPRPAAPRRAAG